MNLNTILVNLLLTSLAAARYVPSDPATCSKDPNKRDLTAQGETDEIQGRRASRILCQACCTAAQMLCDDTCRAVNNGGGGLAFWAMAACQSGCDTWATTCHGKCDERYRD
ncbi:hypothetical protein E4U22_002196 [Claviceps purpurea]|nr:hypothetical protein E4U38_000602 [Claviceps purpurea]KAG6146820.1 hypothetical protein E4U28_008294 [Claviceps purpurea]KAG6162086.1 hypothetical protein E4U51_006625 [Claviceps purpurea]KAG6169373.1 hypothetical protein E4U11_004166 [Claviceps purpurea]KAG6182074.1 hypothetical protein E4U27_002005 [Claviceps purpurea]